MRVTKVDVVFDREVCHHFEELQGLAEKEGPPPDPVIPVLLDAALAYDIKLTLHIEPYKGRTPQLVQGALYTATWSS